jgi:hypothetical protein
VASRRGPYGQRNTAEAIAIAIGVAGVGCVLLWLSARGFLTKHEAVAALFAQLGALLVAAVAIGLLWELVGKRALASEIFEVARVGTDVRNAALLRIGTSYLDDVDWEGYFATVDKLDIFVAYGRTWRGANFHRLRNVAARPSSRIRVYLPNPHDDGLMAQLAVRFNMRADDVKARVLEARREFTELRVDGGGNLTVFYHDGDPLFSCYRFDKTAILTLYSHTRERQNVPTIVCRDGGTLYDFVRKELQAIEQQSRLADEVDQMQPGA